MMWVLFLLITLGIIRHRFYWRVSNKKILIDEKKVFMSHRGYKKTYPENTIAAFIDAISIGFEWLEMDLMTTKDGVVVCSHNFDLETETNGKGYIFDWNAKKGKQLFVEAKKCTAANFSWKQLGKWLCVWLIIFF